MNRIGKTYHALLSGLLILFAIACAGNAAAQAWTQLSPTGGPPDARIVHSAAYNATDNRMIVFGGLAGYSGCYVGDCRNDVWVLTNADGSSGSPVWTQLSPSGTPPSPRGDQVSVYDETNNRLIIFGGDPNIGFCYGTIDDTWVLTNADGVGGTPTWTQLSPTGGPPPIGQNASGVYDPGTNSLIVYGGNVTSCGGGNPDVWVLTFANGLGGTPAWTKLSPTGTIPTARSGHSAAYNASSNRMTVFGGCGSSSCEFQDAWVLTNANGVGSSAWIPLSPTGTPPPGRFEQASIYDPATNSMVVFGGNTTAGIGNDVWRLSHADGTGGTPAWTQLSPSGTLPPTRYGHTAVYNASNDRMVIFGGQNCTSGCVNLNDTWVLSNASGVLDIPVSIDIRPNTAINTISLTNGTNIPVAILSSSTFNALTDVNKTSLTFGHAGTENSLIGCDLRGQDVNADGRKDLVCHFNGTQGSFVMGDTTGYLKGSTTGGNTLHGSDTVVITK
jgi:hypothetical protein